MFQPKKTLPNVPVLKLWIQVFTEKTFKTEQIHDLMTVKMKKAEMGKNGNLSDVPVDSLCIHFVGESFLTESLRKAQNARLDKLSDAPFKSLHILFVERKNSRKETKKLNHD